MVTDPESLFRGLIVMLFLKPRSVSFVSLCGFLDFF